MKKCIHTVPTFSSHVSQVIPFVTNDHSIVYNDFSPEIAQTRQIIVPADESKNLPSDAVSKGTPKKNEGYSVLSACVAKNVKVCVLNDVNLLCLSLTTNPINCIQLMTQLKLIDHALSHIYLAIAFHTPCHFNPYAHMYAISFFAMMSK